MISLILDVSILLLLIITIVAGYRLQKRLKVFRIQTKEFEPLVQDLSTASARAEAVLAEFRKVADDLSVRLTAEADDTQRLLDELDFMTKRADQSAETLENVISGARRQQEQPEPVATAPVAEHPAMAQKVASNDQRRRAPDLEKRLKNLR